MSLVIVIAALLAACAPAPVAAPPPLVLPSERPIAGRDWTYRCQLEPFPASVLREPQAPAEQGTGPEHEALRWELTHRDVPQQWWRVLSRTEEYIEFGHVDPAAQPQPVISLVVRRVAEGWTMDRFGGCRPQAVTDHGLAATWVAADPATVEPGSTRIEALVTESVCASGMEMGDRLLPPVVEHLRYEVVVTFPVRPLPPGAYGCPGNPSTPYTIELGEPLGDRTLLDGGVYPPSDPLT